MGHANKIGPTLAKSHTDTDAIGIVPTGNLPSPVLLSYYSHSLLQCSITRSGGHCLTQGGYRSGGRVESVQHSPVKLRNHDLMVENRFGNSTNTWMLIKVVFGLLFCSERWFASFGLDGRGQSIIA